nr:immunoglobulin light chain junction region [Macaca mulatta]
WQQYNSFPLTF